MIGKTAILLLLASSCLANITEEECEDSIFHLDPDDCPSSYYRCYPNSQGGWNIEHHTCPPGTGFDPNLGNCDWLNNIPDNICDGVTHKPTDGTPSTAGPTTTTPATSPGPTASTTMVASTTTTTTEKPVGSDKIVGCYFGAWAIYRPGLGSFDIDDIDPFLCTHIYYGFANMDNSTWKVTPYDPWYDLAPWDEGCDEAHCHYDSYRRFTRLKQKNPKLKAMLSIGGWTSGSEQWSEMAKDPARRNIFVRSAVTYVQTFGFDGIDFDWEYPSSRDGSDPNYDKADFTALIQELSTALHADGLLLSAAISPDPVKADLGYDIPAVMRSMDFVNIMAYDYHGAWDNFTGHNTPLYGRTEEDVEGHPGYNFNVNDTVNWYLSQGALKEKMVLGTAAYGRGWTLAQNSEDIGLYCPADDGIPQAVYSRQDGIWSYLEILQAFNNDTLAANLPDAKPHQWSIITDGCYMAPFSVNGPYWIGYDDPDSIKLKAQYVNYHDLAGVMMFSVDFDDFRGEYGTRYPLLSALRATIDSGEVLDSEHVLGENSGCESAPIC